jgi:23S rRNA (guanosine2251-2'-O)-methyltransferase
MIGKLILSLAMTKVLLMPDAVIYGLHAVRARLTHSKQTIKALWIQSGPAEQRCSALIQQAQQSHIPIRIVSPSHLSQQFGEVVHQGIVAQVTPLPTYQEADLPQLLQNLSTPAFLLVLDGITDPHNLGACLRSADAAGVNAVILPKDKSVGLTAAVSKVACGAVESVPVITVTNLSRTLSQLQALGIWIYGAAGEAQETIWSIDFKGPIALVMGSEGNGLRRLTREHCDGLFSLPMLGQVESLNVSVATGVSLFEVVRQRHT